MEISFAASQALPKQFYRRFYGIFYGIFYRISEGPHTHHQLSSERPRQRLNPKQFWHFQHPALPSRAHPRPSAGKSQPGASHGGDETPVALQEPASRTLQSTATAQQDPHLAAFHFPSKTQTHQEPKPTKKRAENHPRAAGPRVPPAQQRRV